MVSKALRYGPCVDHFIVAKDASAPRLAENQLLRLDRHSRQHNMVNLCVEYTNNPPSSFLLGFSAKVQCTTK